VLHQTLGVKDSFAVLLTFNCSFDEAFKLDQLVYESDLVAHGCLSQLYSLLSALPGLGEETLRKVAGVGADVRLGKLGVEVKSLLAVKESFFVLALLNVGHCTIREYTLILIQLDCFGVQGDCFIMLTSLQRCVAFIFLSFCSFHWIHLDFFFGIPRLVLHLGIFGC